MHGVHLRNLSSLCRCAHGGARSPAEVSTVCDDRGTIQTLPAGHQIGISPLFFLIFLFSPFTKNYGLALEFSAFFFWIS